MVQFIKCTVCPWNTYSFISHILKVWDENCFISIKTSLILTCYFGGAGGRAGGAAFRNLRMWQLWLLVTWTSTFSLFPSFNYWWVSCYPLSSYYFNMTVIRSMGEHSVIVIDPDKLFFSMLAIYIHYLYGCFMFSQNHQHALHWFSNCIVVPVRLNKRDFNSTQMLHYLSRLSCF